MKDKVVLINQSSSYLMIDIVNAFADKYTDIALICGKLSQSERPLNKNVVVDKIIKYNRKSALKRILTWGVGTVQIFWKLLIKYRKYHIVYVTNPPMSYLCSKYLKNTYSIIVYDVYPDALRNVGIKSGSFIYKWWAKNNKNIFSNAKNIFTLSNGMSNALSAYVSLDKIKVVPLWVASEKFAPIAKKDNLFAEMHNLQDKFVVLYSGNMGYTHSVEVLIEIASQMKDNKNVHFLLIGDGQKKQMMQERVANEKLSNCTILDWQPVDLLPYSLATADLAVVTLNEESAKVSVPSKTFNLMAVGAPLMCISPCESEIKCILDKYKNGHCFTPTDINQMKSFIEKLSADSLLKEELSKKSLLAAKDFTVANAYNYIK